MNNLQKTAVAAIPATCGELVQGTWQGQPCLVSCPIDRYSSASVTISKQPMQHQQQPQFTKSNEALLAGLAWLGHGECNGRFHIQSSIPRGRGYGSSTADMGAVLYALAEACERPLSSTQASFLATQIEPSDSTLFPGLAMFNHINGNLVKALPRTPPLVVLVIDPGRIINTVNYNRQDHRAILDELAPTHQIAFSLLRQGLLLQDWAMVGKAATLSATAHQNILFNPMLDKVLKIAQSMSALGVCRAHSGGVLGLLLDPINVDVNAIYRNARSHLPAKVKMFITSLVAGGPRYDMLSKESSFPKNLKKHGVLSAGTNSYKFM